MSTDTENRELYVSNFILVKILVSKKNASKLDTIKTFLRCVLEHRPEIFLVIYIGNSVLRIDLEINSDNFPEKQI